MNPFDLNQLMADSAESLTNTFRGISESPQEVQRALRSLNYAQALGIPPAQAYGMHDAIRDEMARVQRFGLTGDPNDPWSLARFNAEAPEGVDPFTGATAKTYAGLLHPVVRTAKAHGMGLLGAAELGTAQFTQGLHDALDYIAQKTGGLKETLFENMASEIRQRGKYWQGRAREEGIGPVADFFTSVAGGFVPGVTEFIMDMGGVLHGIRGAHAAAEKGENEFTGFLKGALERQLMGGILHQIQPLSRPLRAATMGGLFEEQSRAAGGSPEDNLKAMLTGGLFGTMGGPGKIELSDLRRELARLDAAEPRNRRLLEDLWRYDAALNEEVLDRTPRAREIISTWDDLVKNGEVTPEMRDSVHRVITGLAKDLGVRVEDVQYDGQEITINPRTADGQLSARQFGLAEKEVSDAAENGDTFRVLGRHELSDRESGAGRSTITVYAGAGPVDVYHEFAHGLDEQGGLPGWRGTAEERAAYLEQRLAAGRQGEIPELTREGARLPGKGEDAAAAVLRPRYSIRPEYREKLRGLAEGEGPDAVAVREALTVQDKIDADPRFWKYNPEKKWMEDNAEYWKSVDPDVLCQRSQGADAAVAHLKRVLGDEYDSIMAWEVIARANERGLPTPCGQCFVFAARAKSGAAMQKKYVIGVGGYSGEILRMKEANLEQLTRRGLRHYSSSDFKAEHIPGLIIETLDAADRGLPFGSYTKSPDYVHVFGPSGAHINLSVGRNENVGMDMAAALKLRKKYPKVSIIYVAFTDAEILKAVRNRNIDHVIPWHGSGQALAEMKAKLGDPDLLDYTKYQSETAEGTPQIQIKENEHGGDLERYLQLCEERGLTKKFPQIYDQLRPGEKRLYMKLIGPEYGKFGGKYPYAPVTKDINYKAIDGVLENRLREIEASPEAAYMDIAKDIADEVQAGTFERGKVEVRQGPLEREAEPSDEQLRTRYQFSIRRDRPWTLTRDEFYGDLRPNELSAERSHESYVTEAIARGLYVPDRVLREYVSDEPFPSLDEIEGIPSCEDWLGTKGRAQDLYTSIQAELTQKQRNDVKRRVREITGQTPAGDIVEMRERDLLNLRFKAEAKVARIAFAEGRAEGRAQAAERFYERVEAARAAREIRAEIRDMIGDLKGAQKDVKRMTAFSADAITELLDGIDLAILQSKRRLSLERTRKWLESSADTELPEYVLDDLARLDRRPIREMTLDEMRSLHQSVMSLAAQSRRVQTIKVGRKQRDRARVLERAIEEMRDPLDVHDSVVSTEPSRWDRFTRLGEWIRSNLGIRQDSYDLIVETLAGPKSVMYDVLYRQVKEAKTAELAAEQATRAAFRQDLDDLGFGVEAGKRSDWLDERQKVGNFNLTRGQRISLYLHSLCEDNRAAILEAGFGFRNPPRSTGRTPNTVIPITEAELGAIVASLSKDERAFAQAARNHFERQGAALAEAFYDQNSYRMQTVENYYPKEVMPMERGGLDADTEDARAKFRESSARVGIDKAMLISRVGSQKPIYLQDVGEVVTKSSARANAYIHLEEALRNASSLLYSLEFRRNVIDRYGRETWVELEKGLKDIAGGYREMTDLEAALVKLKTSTVKSVLKVNPWIWANQPFGVAMFTTYIEIGYLMRGIVDSALRPREVYENLRRYSPELVERVRGGYDRDVRASFKAARDAGYFSPEKIIGEEMWMTKFMDLVGIVPGMQAAVHKAMAEFEQGRLSKPLRDALDITDADVARMTPEQKVEAAHKFADWCVQRTQAVAMREHMSPMARGASFVDTMLTSFGSQTNAMLNATRRTYREYQRTKDPEDLRALAKAVFQVYVLNAVVMTGIDKTRDFIYGRNPKAWVTGILDNTAGLFFGLRDLEKGIVSHLEEGEGRGKDVKYVIQRPAEYLTQGASAIHTILTTEKLDKRDDAWLAFIDAALGLAACSTGKPYEAPKRLMQAVTGNNPPPEKEDKGHLDLDAFFGG